MSKFFVLKPTFENRLNISQIFGLLFIVSLFFPIRYVFPGIQAFKTGAYSDFTSISLYLSDILLGIAWLFLFLPRGIMNFTRAVIERLSIKVLVLWLILGVLWNFSSNSTLNLWFIVKTMEAIVAYGTFAYLFRETSIKSRFFKLFVSLGVAQAILAILQFLKQASLGHGLGKLGEQVISPHILGVAKIVSGGTTLIRGYGTYPHPNLLSAFLTVSLLISLYPLAQSVKFRDKAVYVTAFVVILVGLCVTFSRAGYLAVIIGLLIMLAGICFSNIQNKASQRSFWQAFGVVSLSLLVCFFIFKPLILTRATITDQASLERKFYSKIGVQMIKDHPAFGLGIGESVLHMEQYAGIKLYPWQIQPIHNYFLLAAAELGIAGALILLWVFIEHAWGLIRNTNREYNLLLFAILVSLLVLMQFDHYFYTLEQTQLLLWVLLGIVSSETKKLSTK